ncbi:MAG: biotin/lipoyl-binding protein [Eubacteriales bacterium]|nr:biotin/lipoyl-binding protein [Eubacteriales bacterium]MDD3882313.1 biotin/lipoyl-binding protein [Eubacteriales bacterium]MDD4512059.1 biotin/lipoyl-binding protein [Eubacteriales bacterium]
MKKLAAIVMLLMTAAVCVYISAGGAGKASAVTAPIKRGIITETLPITLTAQYADVSAVSAGTAGIVKEVYVSEGERVKKGDALMRFSFTGGGTEGLMVRAGEDGVVSAVSVIKGAAIGQAATLFTLSGGEIRYIAEIPAEDAAKLNIGAPIALTGGEARITEITQLGGGFARITAEPPYGSSPRTGEKTRGEALIRMQENVLMLPLSAATGEEIWVSRAGRARKASVEYGLIGGGYAAVFGLCDGDRLIVSDTSGLYDGMEIAEAER